MFHKSKPVEVKKGLKKYFEFVEYPGKGSKGTISCLHEDCKLKQAKPRIFDPKQGWKSHENHLVTQHGISLESMLLPEGSQSIVPFVIRKGKLGVITNANTYKKHHPKQTQFLSNVMDLVCIAGVPVSLVEHRIFLKFVRDLDSSIRLPSRSTLTRRISTEVDKIITINRRMLQNVQTSSLHFSFDLWSTRNHRTVIGIKAHFIDEFWRLRNFVLGFVNYEEKKQGDKIRKAFIQQLRTRYNIRPDQVGFVMADNARENVNAFGDAHVFMEEVEEDDIEAELMRSDDEDRDSINWSTSQDTHPEDSLEVTLDIEEEEENLLDETSKWLSKEIVRLGCVNHSIQLVVKECLAKNPRAVDIQKQLDKLVAFFNRSNYWHAKLIKKTKKGLIKVGDTRWNGFLHSLSRLLEPKFIQHINGILQEAHGSSSRRANIPDLVSPAREVEISELCQLLTPFLTLTLELQGDNVTSSLVILGIITLYKQVASVVCTTDYMKALKSSLCLSITERFAAKEQFFYAGRGAKKNLLRVFDNEAYILATVLDPRWKMTPFEISLHEPYQLDKYIPSIEKVKNLLKREYEKEKGVGEEIRQSTEVDSAGPSKISRVDFLSSFIPTNTDVVSPEQFTSELEEYLKEKRIERSADPLEYYRDLADAGKFPIISRLARKYLSFPATSFSMERVFSITGSFNRARRASLATAMMEKFILYREHRKECLGI